MTLISISLFLLQKKPETQPQFTQPPSPREQDRCSPEPKRPDPPQVPSLPSKRLRDLSDEAIPTPLPYSLAGGPPEVLIS